MSSESPAIELRLINDKSKKTGPAGDGKFTATGLVAPAVQYGGIW
jgi:hypothetical protein